MLFSRCRFLAVDRSVLPWSVGAIYADCRMKQRSLTASFPRGRFLGSNVIEGVSNITGSLVEGELVHNGRRYSRQRV